MRKENQLKNPLIGITPLWNTEQDNYWMRPGYVERVLEAGGMPVILPLTDSLEQIEFIADTVDGLLFTGGPDVDPSYYGSTDQTGTVETNPMRDRFEIALMRAARKKDVPTFCICRGVQLLNIVMGGTLYEDIPLQYQTHIQHWQSPPYSEPSHTVQVDSESRLFHLIQQGNLKVNSAHHQAIRDLGKNLRAAALSPDGLVEAVETNDSTFCFGVQWHPEMLPAGDDASRALFHAFIDACK